MKTWSRNCSQLRNEIVDFLRAQLERANLKNRFLAYDQMTLFEKIAAREIPAKIILEDEDVIVLHDINPQAPVHVLIVPKKPIPRLADATTEDGKILGKLLSRPKKWPDRSVSRNPDSELSLITDATAEKRYPTCTFICLEDVR